MIFINDDKYPSKIEKSNFQQFQEMKASETKEVTIGLPVYNGASNLNNSINALLRQSHRDFTMIICDNASTDNTQSICEKFQRKDSRIKYVRNETNLGAVRNFSRSLFMAETPYFMWAAHDDHWDPTFIEKCLKVMTDSPNAGFAMPLYTLKSTKWKVWKKINHSTISHITDENTNKRVLLNINTHRASNICNMVYSLFKTSVLRSAYEIQDISNDGLLCIAILNAARGGIVDEHLFFKQNRNLWPGAKRPRRIYFRKAESFVYARDAESRILLDRYPQLEAAIELIRINHKPGEYLKDFRIVAEDRLAPYF